MWDTRERMAEFFPTNGNQLDLYVLVCFADLDISMLNLTIRRQLNCWRIMRCRIMRCRIMTS